MRFFSRSSFSFFFLSALSRASLLRSLASFLDLVSVLCLLNISAKCSLGSSPSGILLRWVMNSFQWLKRTRKTVIWREISVGNENTQTYRVVQHQILLNNSQGKVEQLEGRVNSQIPWVIGLNFARHTSEVGGKVVSYLALFFRSGSELKTKKLVFLVRTFWVLNTKQRAICKNYKKPGFRSTLLECSPSSISLPVLLWRHKDELNDSSPKAFPSASLPSQWEYRSAAQEQ